MIMVSMAQLKDFLRKQKRVPLMDLAHHFNKDPEVLRDMLSHWERKGQLRRIRDRAGCQSTCSGCGTGPTELCEWIDPIPT
ncbi:MAG: FeoC-like transcriptional regulator [Magnetococcales bacterium]|nr:FeoC-like transcriptional regulator [Magnetococcales bacterium]